VVHGITVRAWHQHGRGRIVVSLGLSVAVLILSGCTSSSSAQLKIRTPRSGSLSAGKGAPCTPTVKCFGVFLQGSPANVAPITDKAVPTSIASEAGKQPNLVMFYQAWGPTLAAGIPEFIRSAQNACGAGMTPMMTWESWDTSVTNPDQGTAYDQPLYSLQSIINGKYDAYIRQTAAAIKKLNCPIAIRLDQEQNGFWYPWGVSNKGMKGVDQPTPARYVAMWRHVWQIFQAEGANSNVIWTWSPNQQGVPASTTSPRVLAKSYPGNAYVDWIALDGYFFNDPTLTFSKLFGPTISQLRPYASGKPLLIGETGVGGPDLSSAKKASQLTNLIDSVASRKSFVGFVYFDQSQVITAKDEALDADWKLDQTAASRQAFSSAIGSSVYGAG
jgi:mannan endo-1,4-beta-mannosidase